MPQVLAGSQGRSRKSLGIAKNRAGFQVSVFRWDKSRRTADCVDGPSGSRLCQPGLITTVAEKGLTLQTVDRLQLGREAGSQGSAPEKRCQSSGPYMQIKTRMVLPSVVRRCNGTTAWHHLVTAMVPEDVTGAGLLFLPNNVFFS